jgi:polyisoprenoid-binding protein YceI
VFDFDARINTVNFRTVEFLIRAMVSCPIGFVNASYEPNCLIYIQMYEQKVGWNCCNLIQTNYICPINKNQSMKKITQVLAAVGLLFLASCGGAEKADAPAVEEMAVVESVEATYNVVVDASSVHWKGEMMGMYSHEGEIKFTSGTVTIKDGAIVGGDFVIDMTSMSPTDENFDEEKTPGMLVGHLSSEDFFAVESNPTASFLFTGADAGNLTVRGKTNPETLTDVVLVESEAGLKATASMTFVRQNYDVAFAHPMQEMVISDDVVLSIQIVGIK